MLIKLDIKADKEKTKENIHELMKTALGEKPMEARR